MNVFADAVTLIANLGDLKKFAENGSLSQQWERSGGEYLAGNIASSGADVAAIALAAKWGGISTQLNQQAAARQTAQFLNPQDDAGIARMEAQMRTQFQEGADMTTPSPIPPVLIGVILAELTMGFGPPHEGDELKDGSKQFTTIHGQLQSALPDRHWQGSASAAYANLGTTQQDLAQTMAELDLQMAATVKNQAEWITHMRLGFAILKDLLIAAIVYEVLLKLSPAPGPAVAVKFARIVARLGAAIAAAMLGTVFGMSMKNAEKLDGLTTQYEQVAADAKLPGTTPAPTQVAAAAQPTVPSLEAVSSSLSGISDATKAPSVAPGSQDEHAPLSALTDEGKTPEDTRTPDETLSTPGLTIPTLSQLVQISEHGAKQKNVVNQVIGQIQQLASPGPKRQRAAAPAEEAGPEDAALAEDTEGAGAARDAKGAGRAPTEVAAVGAKEAQQPGPAENRSEPKP